MRLKHLSLLLILLLIIGFAGALSFSAVSKGLIGKNDIKLWDGKTSTFTRVSSSGRHLTLNKVDWPGVDIKMVYGTRTDVALTNAMNSVGSTNLVSFWLSPGTWTIASDITITSNITLAVPPGAILSVSSGKTLTIEGPVLAGPYQIFSGSGTITITIDILEHDQWRDATGDDIFPSVDNAVDLGDSTYEFKDGYFDGTLYADAIDFNGTAISATAAELNIMDGVTATEAEIDTIADGITATAAEVNLLPHVQQGYTSRAKFLYVDGDEIYIDAGAYNHEGTANQIVYWDSRITFELESAGSNALSDDYGADVWHYIYLDDTAIVTQASQLLDADCFLNDTTGPSWSDAKHGWYNGNDRCIFAVYETGGSLQEFYHDGNTVMHATEQLMLDDVDPGTTFADLDIEYGTDATKPGIPGFARTALMRVVLMRVDGASSAIWRTNGSSAGGFMVCYVKDLANDTCTNTFTVITDSSQLIEHKIDASNNTVEYEVWGWKFPTSM